MPEFGVRNESFDVPRAFEARAWEAALAGNYDEAIRMAWEWLRDEPFATRATSFGAWVASTAKGDFRAASDIAEAARVANPDDPRLLTHLVYCYASMNELERAERLLTHELAAAVRKSPHRMSDIEWQVISAADRGLIAFRRGLIAEGRLRYREAIETAMRARHPALRVGALINLAREEALANPSAVLPSEELEDALGGLPEELRPPYERFIDRVRLTQQQATRADEPRRTD